MLLKHYIAKIEPKENTIYKVVFYSTILGAYHELDFNLGLSDLEYILSSYGDMTFLAAYTTITTEGKELISFEILC
jgi:hypothetical protein